MCSLAPNVVNQYLFLVTWFMIVVTIGLNVLNVLGSLFELAFYRSFYGWIRKINPGNAPTLTFPSDIMTIRNSIPKPNCLQECGNMTCDTCTLTLDSQDEWQSTS